ncbi:TonB-dependent receptor [Sphingomonas glaciei]|uniref:TonB-dependent receptor n=1 Tax=Sphingomonas glaciei TaxID=2938948 RepID=A0ABY5MWR3_9SPHN|nr:TonB-dependent receptor [Sphingomonas glaciei]UUR08890.1 TonB-dependent receptor [Sphingomonas glaciei]
MKKLLLLSTAVAFVPTAAFAQSTGTQETERDTIVVTGTRSQPGTAGVVVQDSTKAKGLITQELISKGNPGQSVLNSINIIPGVNFTQSDPYGSSGGNIRIRGFDGNRISLTLNGVQLNDSGNYAVYSNQQVDPELIEQINVNLGATDVDSPTASAAGGTINLRTALPTRDVQVRGAISGGSFNFRRAFVQINTGDITSGGLRAWVSGSRTNYDHWRGEGEIQKTQFNTRIYQPLANGDFVSLVGHYNENRNNNYNNPTLADLRTIFNVPNAPAIVPTTYTGSPVVVGDYSKSQWDRIDDLAFFKDCLNSAGVVQTRPTPVNGTIQSDPATCFTPGGPLATQGLANKLSGQINPSNTGNVGLQSRFTLRDGLILTVDPTYQYTLANGGSQTALIAENSYLLRQGVAGSTGVDLNGDRDTLDTVLLGRPSITNTNRATLVTSLVWRPSRQHTLRASYTFDRAHHRQTGEYSFTGDDFSVLNPFFGRNGPPVITAAGTVLQNRDRVSIALLNQLSGQYIGRFVDNRLRVEVGLRSPWFERQLDQRCFTPAAGGGFPDCVQPADVSLTGPNSGRYLVPNNFNPPVAGLLGTPEYAPFKATYKYHKLLPNVGATFAVTDAISIFSSYSKGFSAPRTDNLYRQPFIGVTPESTNSYDLGARYVTRRLQAEATAWKIDYSNRIVSSFDPITNLSIDRNVGKVKSWGVDANIGTRVATFLNLIGNVSYTKAELQDDIVIGAFNYVPVAIPATSTTAAINASTNIGSVNGLTYFCNPLPTTLPTSGVNTYNVCARTGGKQVVETPKWQIGGRAEINFSPVVVGIQGKYVGDRFATDVNDVVSKGYTYFDLDARVGLPFIPNQRSYVQVNVSNLFNARYFGNLSTSINAFGFNSSQPRFTSVAPRAIMATLNLGL